MRTPLSLCPVFLLAAGLLAVAEPPKPAEPDAEVVYAEKVLKDANVAVDGPALIAFFKARTLTPAGQEKMTAALRKLGDDNFEVREVASKDLIAGGRLALAYLRPALKADDLEVATRARRCIEEIERVPDTSLIPSAARLLAEKNPEGATETLLDCLPWLADDSAQEAVFQALIRTALKDGAPNSAIAAAAKDKGLLRRSAAAFVLGRGNADARRMATVLLTDADARVRYNAAASLVRSGDKAAIPPLVALLVDAPAALAWQAEDVLCQLAGEKAPTATVGAGDVAERRKAKDAWEAWWKENGDKIDLAKINLDDASQRLTLVVESDGRIWECGPDREPRWELKNAGRPLDARALPGGRVLITEYIAHRITERDHKGTILWEHAVQDPVTSQRLANGNTFIGTYHEVREVSPDGKVVYSHKSQNGMIYHAEKLRDGRILYVTSNNTIYEMSADGKVDKTISTNAGGTTQGWASVERLANGNYLLALYSSNKVVELDSAGKVVWSIGAPNPGNATRLRNGNTLVASIEGRTIYEYDRAGKEVWSVKAPGRPFHAWRR